MSVKLISKTEKYSFEFEGSTFYYRRIPAPDASLLRKKYTSGKGVFDDDSFGQELLEQHVIGWDGVLGSDGKEVKFDKTLVPFLPSPLLIDLISKINGQSFDDPSGETLEKK